MKEEEKEEEEEERAELQLQLSSQVGMRTEVDKACGVEQSGEWEIQCC